jgi:ATP-binding cassette subfamily B protein
MKLVRFILSSLKGFKINISTQILCLLVMAIDGNIRPYLIKLLIDQVHTSNASQFLRIAYIFIGSQLFMVLVNASFDWLGTLFHTRYRSNILHSFHQQISKYNYRFFQDTQLGSITSRITDAFNILPMLIFIVLKVFINFVFFVLVATIMLSQISVIFVAIMLIWIAIFLSLVIFFYKKYEPLNADYATVRPRIYGFLSDYFANIWTVRFFSNQRYEGDNLTKLSKEFITKSTKCGLFLRNYYAAHGLIIVVYMAAILMLLAHLIQLNQITTGDLALVFMINYKIADMLLDISNQSRDFIINCGIASNAISILHDDAKDAIQPNNASLITKKVKDGSIVFKDVNFGYTSEEYIFHNLNIAIPAKQKVGIVGYSGSGKSTLINLMLKLYHPNSGQIIIDDIDTSTMSEAELMAAIALVDQNPSLFHRSIYENIQYGNMQSSQTEVHSAACKALAAEFIEQLPESYQTIVGEKGMKLSGGQRQRIAIARAILKDAPIFVLDEATSQLDSVTEQFIQNNLHQLIKDKTAILIAHRLSTIMMVDRILVFDKGKIVEDGSFEQLLNAGGTFAQLWQAQKDGFLPT